MARELLIFNAIDFKAVPVNQRLKALGQKVKQLSPFSRTGHYVHWSDGYALVWIWDEDKRRSAVQEISQRFSPLAGHFERLTVIPETVLQPTCEWGEKRQPCVDGLDLQTWEAGRLVSSSWSPGFQKEIIADSAVREGWDGTLGSELDEKILWQSGLSLILLVIIFQLGNAAGLWLKNSYLQHQISVSEEDMATVLAVRGQVRKTREGIEALSSWRDHPGQLSLLAEFDRLMPSSVEIISWTYENKDLRVLLRDENLDNRLYIERLSKSSRFVSPRVEPGVSPDTVELSLAVVTR